MSVKLLCVGKIPKEVDRLCRRKANETGVCLEVIPDEPDKEKTTAIRRESDAILSKIAGSARVFLFDVEGTTSFSDIRLSRENVFVIGGSNGVDDRVKARAYRRISLSSLTYPHALFRLLALELLSGIKTTE